MLRQLPLKPSSLITNDHNYEVHAAIFRLGENSFVLLLLWSVNTHRQNKVQVVSEVHSHIHVRKEYKMRRAGILALVTPGSIANIISNNI